MINVGEQCIYCDESVAWGSGLYVNRIPADDGEKTGFMCGVCVEEAEELADECRPEMFGFTIIDRDGGEMFTSDPEYPSYKEAERAGDHSLCDLNGGSLEVWLWDESLEDVTKTWEV